MKHYGTVESYDENLGRGQIKPETTGDSIGFEKSAFTWDGKTTPETGKRLSYDVSEMNGKPCAVNLQHG